jgi:hypothetical protein
MSYWFLFVVTLSFVGLSFFVDDVFLVNLAVESTAAPVIILRWVMLISLYLPFVVVKDSLLLCRDNSNSILKHVEAV